MKRRIQVKMKRRGCGGEDVKVLRRRGGGISGRQISGLENVKVALRDCAGLLRNWMLLLARRGRTEF